MKKFLALSSLLLLVLFGPMGMAFAQEGQPEWPQYIIQAGDTLSSISLRFNISLDELITFNNIEDPNQLLAGTPISLPGVDWIQGTINPEFMPFGDSLRSLSRRYLISPEDLALLNRLSSPAQLYVGYPVLFPTGRGEDLSLGRAVVGPQTSLLEMAVFAGANPWTMAATNQLAGTWEAVRGDVLLQPGVAQSGPGALPSPISQVDVNPLPIVQGDTVVVRVSAESDFTLGGELIDHTLNFFKEEGASYVALQGVDALLDPGFYLLDMEGDFADGRHFSHTQTIQVRAGGYGFETITVEPELLDPELSRTELEFLMSYTTVITPEKYWQGIFQSPSPNEDGINSYFGTRRSYNDGPYNVYHTGIDFGGGQGLPIYAPASGKVVFAGFKDIRGNMTVIDHGWGVFSVYYHQSEILVVAGEMVEPGHVIGMVGNTGRSEGAHLHFEMWAGGVIVEPLDWLTYTYP
ncbi:MAG: peptidoglycan DD-metalloendopeptidase family protein [Anaerolineales bacterium]|nr:peptidoglycan DD-metalloendopeptidase family protein [Anaerolineales bacterium]